MTEAILLNPETRLGSAIERGRHWVGTKLVTLAADITGALVELALRVAPMLSGSVVRNDTRRRIWPGLLVIALLTGGLVLAGGAGFLAIREATHHREPTS